MLVVLNNKLRLIYLVDLVAGQQMQVLVHRPRAVDVTMRRVGSSTSVAVDPLEPMLSTMASLQVLKIVRDGNALSLNSTKEVLLDWVCVVAERHLDGSLKAVEIAVVAGALVSLMLLHKRKQFLGSPALSLEVVVVGGRSACVHLVAVSSMLDVLWQCDQP